MLSHLRDLILYLAVFSFFVAARQAPAADTWPVPRGPSREPAPYQYDAKIWRQVPKEFREDAPAVILYSGTTHIIEDDGTVETITHEVTRLNGRKGIESLGEYRSIYFDPSYQKLVLNEARVIKANGQTIAIEPKHVQLRDVATDYQIYDQDKQLVISFPNLEVDDVYEVKWTVRGRNPEFAGKFFTRYTFGDDTYPVVRDELHVLTSPTQVFKYAAVNGVLDVKIAEHDGRKHYCWKVANRGELSKDDDRPSKEELRLHVACSTFASWEQVAQWKQKLRADCWQCLPPVQKTIEEVTRGLESPLEKARALTYWVRRHIRYLSRGPAGAGYTPHLPHQVLANLFGDCKDQAQLLAVMLREIGLDPYLVTLGTLDDGQVAPEVPSPWGTHAMVMVTIDGKDYWIDTTVSQAAWDYLPRGDRDRLVYLTREGELKLARTPALTYADNRIEHKTRVAVRPHGTSHNQRTSVYQGSSALTRRDAWIEVPPGERRRLLSAELQDANQRTRIISLSLDDRNLNDFDQPVQAQLTYQIPKHFAGDSGKEGSLSDSQVWNRLLSFTLDPERTLPLHLGTPFESIHRFVVDLPPAFRFDDLPNSVEVTSRWGFFKLDVQADAARPRRLQLSMHTRLAEVRVEPKDFAAFQQFHDELSKSYRVWLNLRPTSELADVPLLELTLALAPWSDPVSASTLARLYLDHGKYNDARRVLRTACIYHSQDRGLWDMRVQAAASLDEEEEIYRDMVRHFRKDAKLKVALGATRIKRGDHAGARRVLEPLTANKMDKVRGAAHFQLARSYFEENQYPAALRHLEAAGEADPQVVADASSLHFKAQVQEKLGQQEEAITSYREVLALEHDALDTLVPLIGLELKAGQTKDALDHVRRFTLAVGDDPAGLTLAAEFHLEMNRLEDAFELAGRARAAGFVANNQRVLGLVHFRKKELDKAIFHLERSEVESPDVTGGVDPGLSVGGRSCQSETPLGDGPVPGRRQGHVRPDQNRGAGSDVGHAVCEQLWRQDMNLPRRQEKPGMEPAINHYLCADLAYQNHAARDQLARLLSGSFVDGVDLGPALALRGLVYLEKGNLKAAFADVQRALQLKPVDGRAFYVRGRVRLERDEPGAVSDLERAATLSRREDGVILHWLAAALFEAGRPEDARIVQRRALELKPVDAELADQNAKVEYGNVL